MRRICSMFWFNSDTPTPVRSRRHCSESILSILLHDENRSYRLKRRDSLFLFSESKIVLPSGTLRQSCHLQCQKLVFLQPHRKHNLETGNATERVFMTLEPWSAYSSMCTQGRKTIAIRAEFGHWSRTVLQQDNSASNIQRIVSSFSNE